ncbi:hypothetical protein [Sphingobacterium sp. HMA12]|uniref:hypothetical protein n=1 Tax=Sphingobacterium sp. HMA12 TaxID=2050894 RepID=UPI000CEA0CFF|nr:hypothetical protein [Sphingobacterium sp. HMA12]
MSKQGLVYCIQPEQYDVFDERISKPICIKQVENGIEKGSMVFQELDEVNFAKNPLTYFPPNNVGLLLSICKRHLVDAKKLFKEYIDPHIVNHSFVDAETNKKEFLKEKSKIVADYIEAIQICIVFGYTALETFSNLSITETYQYKVNVKSRGVVELYDKKAIERWVSLADKLSKILPEIYETKKIETTKFWSYFIKLEKYRHDIIHQKTIERTDFYKTYFNKDIFEICASAEYVLKFFYEAHSDKQRTNPLWPWLINKDKEFPVTFDFKSENYEVVGNLFEGNKRYNKKNR